MSPKKVNQKPFLSKRLQSLRQILRARNLDALLVSKPQNRFYLTGWPGDFESGYLLITEKANYLFTDSRYTEEVVNSVFGFEIVDIPQTFPTVFAQLTGKLKLGRIGFESHDLSFFNYKRLRKITRSKLTPIAHSIEDLRAVKDESEVANLKKAVEIDKKAFEHIRSFIKPGLTEAEVAWELEKKIKELGAEKVGWHPLIVAAGANSSIPHYGNSPKVKVKKGDILQLDFGSVFAGYHSDTSRAIFVGKPSKEQIEIYQLVLQAQELGESLVRSERTGAGIHQKVQDFLKGKSKFYFTHGLGHGVGLEIHELPRVSPAGKKKLKTGNCVTIEPGIYRPGWGGVRLEDIVLVKDKGCEVITKISKEIKDITL